MKEIGMRITKDTVNLDNQVSPKQVTRLLFIVYFTLVYEFTIKFYVSLHYHLIRNLHTNKVY